MPQQSRSMNTEHGINGSDGVKPGSAQARAEFFYDCLKSSSRKISRLKSKLKKNSGLKGLISCFSQHVFLQHTSHATSQQFAFFIEFHEVVHSLFRVTFLFDKMSTEFNPNPGKIKDQFNIIYILK
jgi:hypothetical protein